MTERPILFSAPMVRAILDGSKTQTRRVCKPAQKSFLTYVVDCLKGLWGDEEGEVQFKCPYGQPGDRLWVRETWGVVSNDWDEDGNLIDWIPDRPAIAINEMPFGQGYYSGHAIYAADGTYEWAGDDDGGGEPRSAWHPSIHMPRSASHILLEIVSVRVERLNSCSEEDARAEGLSAITKDGKLFKYGIPDRDGLPGTDNDGWPWSEWEVDPVAAYANLWEKINGAGSWDANPWVWVVEFRRLAGESGEYGDD